MCLAITPPSWLCRASNAKANRTAASRRKIEVKHDCSSINGRAVRIEVAQVVDFAGDDRRPLASGNKDDRRIDDVRSASAPTASAST
jgi:hypothetical protein